MTDSFIDINLEIFTLELDKERDPTRYVWELARETADRHCAEAGGRLRTDRAPEIFVSEGLDRLTGQAITLVATRWAVVLPDAVAP